MQAFFQAMGGAPPQMGIGEIPLHSGPANHWRGVESVGGWLYLTNQRLLFTPHSVGIQTHQSSIDLFQIASVEAGASLWIIPNQLVVVTKSGKREKFVVQGREQWVEMIRTHVQHSPYGR
jgi:hypothetical protein